MNNISYIIVQAGGKGTRMKNLTRNKPKALVPIQNLPMIFHLFKAYPDKKFIIIGDYKFDVLKKYLEAFCTVDYVIVNGSGNIGTCAGLKDALKIIPEHRQFMLIWSDLVLSQGIALPKDNGNYIGISKEFRCRWSYVNGEFKEEASMDNGVAGCFIFADKYALHDVPDSGEFVRYLKDKPIKFKELPLYGTCEYGLLEEYSRLSKCRCRPFNKLTVKESTIIKEGIDAQGKELALIEKAWYKKLITAGFKNIPQIYSYEPLEMERIDGKNIYEYASLNAEQKNIILNNLVSCLKEVHSLGEVKSDYLSYEDAYIEKTIKRLDKVKDLVPFAKDSIITINGRRCRNIFYNWDKVRDKINQYYPSKFKLIHGDCTFSNLMLRNKDLSPVLIDPRGYFGFTQFFGDVAYEWAKLYYSIVGNYDQFNLKNFELSINESDVELTITSNGWEDMEGCFLRLIEDEVSEQQIKLIHAIIWLSLTTYAWEDYDSICGAFYNGLYYLEEVL